MPKTLVIVFAMGVAIFYFQELLERWQRWLSEIDRSYPQRDLKRQLYVLWKMMVLLVLGTCIYGYLYNSMRPYLT